MALSGNKGEWSEIYTLFKLLGEGIIHAGDANMNKLDLYYPILNIIRNETKKYEYKPNAEHHIVVIVENGSEYISIPMQVFKDEATALLQQIKDAQSRSFEVSAAEAFMNKIGCTKLKAPSHDKADIHIVIHDSITNMTPLLGFSIKSQLGGASTLLNAGETTNILYTVVGGNISDGQIDNINSINSHLERMGAIYNYGCTLKYSDIENQTFKNNLLLIDSLMPEFIANCLIVDSMPNSTSGIKEIVYQVAQNNPFNYTGNNVLRFYEYKMKTLLLTVALGMTPAKEWDGDYDANGGYIVVRKDGEIVCYHFYYQNDIKNYLFNNTRFERASRSRYNFGTLFRGGDGKVYIRLNLQIRFKK